MESEIARNLPPSIDNESATYTYCTIECKLNTIFSLLHAWLCIFFSIGYLPGAN